MSTTILKLTPQDPIVARDGRPFGAGQGNRMRGMSWPLPSVVAGSFRTALVKADSKLDFADDMPQRLMAIEVAGVFPTVGSELYLPTPDDCLWDDMADKVHRVVPIGLGEGEGVDFPLDDLLPVRLSQEQANDDFKAASVPVWWPVSKFTEWLTSGSILYRPDWFTPEFLGSPHQEMRDHVCLDADRGAAAEGQIFATAGLNVTYLPRFYAQNFSPEQKPKSFANRVAEIALSARVTIPDSGFGYLNQLNTWHPLGGERRLVHWQHADNEPLWHCPEAVRLALSKTDKFRMILTTPAIFANGWKPHWLNEQLEGIPPGTDVKLKLVGVCNHRWKAVSGWSLAPPRGPKAIRRMVPAGSVYFFQKVEGGGESLATNGWLRPVSDALQDRNDGFGLAVWGTW